MRIITKNTTVFTSTRYDNEGNIASEKVTNQETYSIEVLPEEVLDAFIEKFQGKPEWVRTNILSNPWAELGILDFKDFCPELNSKQYTLFYRAPRFDRPDADGVHRCELPANRKSWEGITEYRGVKIEKRQDFFQYDFYRDEPEKWANPGNCKAETLVFILDGKEYYATFITDAVVFWRPYGLCEPQNQPKRYREAVEPGKYHFSR